MKTSLRTVPDTNVVIAAQNSSSTSPNKEFFSRWQSEEFALLFSRDTLAEYVKKLTGRQVPRERIKQLIVAIKRMGEPIPILFFHLARYPSDPDDVAFVLCAENGYATHLISYDNHLLVLQGSYSFKICKTVDFLSELRQALESATA